MSIISERFTPFVFALLISGSVVLQSETMKRSSFLEEQNSAKDQATRGSSLHQNSKKPLTAGANFLDSTGKKVGTATLTEQAAGGVLITFDLSGLPVGTHGIHIHETGTCTQPDFKSAAKHFSLGEKKQHGKHNPEGPHAGDLGNIEVDAAGTAKLRVKASEVTLAAGVNSLLKPGGTAIVVHDKRDDEKTDPSGDSGDRIACGVIQAPAFGQSAIHGMK